MFESYKVAVKVALQDEVSKGLIGLSTSFSALGKKADELQTKLDRIKKIAMVGIGFGAAGFMGLNLMSKALKPAEEYAHQLNIMNIAGLKQKEIAEAINAAWVNTSKVPTSTVVGNLKTFMDLRNIFGHGGEAIQYMPELTMIQQVLKSSSESGVSQNADTLVYSLAKALDIRGAVNNPREFNEQAEMMSKVIAATQGRVLPQDYQMLFKYGRQGIPGLSNKFLYEELPTFMQEMKGSGGGGSSGGFGTSIASFYRFFVQGVMSKAAMQGMIGLGLINPNAGLKTTTVGTQLMQGQHVKGVDLAQSDPFEWVQQYLLPAIRKKYGENLTKNQMSLAIGDAMRGASVTSIFATLQYALKSQQVYRDQKLIQQAMDPKSAYQASLSNDPNAAFKALSAQWTNLKTALGMEVIPILLPTIINIADEFNHLAKALREHPALAKALSLGFMGLFSSMAAVGSLLLIGAGGKGLIIAFRVLTLALTPLLIPLGGIGTLLAAIGVTAYAAYKALQVLPGALTALKDILGFNGNGKSSIFSTFNPINSNRNNVTEHHTHLFLDGKQVAKVVTQHQANEASKQPAHGSVFNGNMFLQPNMLNPAGAF